MANESMMTAAETTSEAAPASTEAVEGSATAAEATSQQQATEGQTTTEATTEEAQGAPEKYEFAPIDGVTVSDGVISEFSTVAKELGMTQEAAQKVLSKMAPALQASQAAQIEAIRGDWANKSTADTEFGGEKLQENLSVAKKALDTFGTPELRALLNESGLGNHPEIIRAFYRAGKAISEDKFVGGASGAPRTAKSFYPNSNMN